MSENPILLPAPRNLTVGTDICQFPSDALLLLNCTQPGELLFAVQRLINEVETNCDQSWQIAAGTAVPQLQAAVVITVLPGAMQHEQGYKLVVEPAGLRSWLQPHKALFMVSVL